MNCPICGSEIKDIPAGVSKKSGKPYSAFSICSNDECGFKPVNEQGRKSVVVATNTSKPNGQTHPEMIMSYAKDVIVAQIEAGQFTGQPSKEIIVLYRELLSEVTNPNSVK